MERRILTLFFGVILVVLGWFGWRTIQGSPQVQDTIITAAVPPVVLTTDPVIGSADARVTIIEYGDFQCPSCRQMRETIALLGVRHPGDLRIVWKDFPIENEHPFARTAAEAARCAQEQGSFWQYHDLLFANQENLGPDLLDTLASQRSLDIEAFRTCRTERRYRGVVQESMNVGIASGVDGAPFLFINNVPYAQPLTITEIDSIVSQLLAAS